MSDNVNNITEFISKNFMNAICAIAVFFLMGIYSDFKDVKVTLQQMLVNQATMELRMTNKETLDKKQDERLDKLETYHIPVNKVDNGN